MSKFLSYAKSVICHPTFIILTWLTLLVLGVCLTACSPFNIPKVTPPVILHPVPPNLGNIDHSLDIGFVIGIGAIVAAVVVFYLVPLQHRISLALAGGGGTLLGLSVFFKTTMWILPYIAAGALILGLLFGVYEIYVNYIRKGPVVS